MIPAFPFSASTSPVPMPCTWRPGLPLCRNPGTPGGKATLQEGGRASSWKRSLLGICILFCVPWSGNLACTQEGKRHCCFWGPKDFRLDLLMTNDPVTAGSMLYYLTQRHVEICQSLHGGKLVDIFAHDLELIQGNYQTMPYSLSFILLEGLKGF